MKLAVSNIAWVPDQDEIVYQKMAELGFTGLEIAPTRIFSEHPYDHLEEAARWREDLHRRYGFEIPSMQSIWYGRTESIFGPPEEQNILLSYTYRAIDFAAVIGCRNLVFGCPKNRCVPEGVNPDTAISFFQRIAEYAVLHKVIIGIEANPPIYHTNYINTTKQALDLIEKVSSPGLRLNLDVGTMLHNRETTSELNGKVYCISHVHISEPMLAPVKQHQLHKELRKYLSAEKYDMFVSIEMGRSENIGAIFSALEKISNAFGD